MKTIQNPILTGSHPDPSIVRTGKEFYIATSTFEWWPGVQIFHSQDLSSWQLVSRPLDSSKFINLKGIPDSGGIWAPCLSFDQGCFYLVYSVVETLGQQLDVCNYLTTSEKVTGPWSDPVFLNSSGIDPSLFHDDDGKKWLLNTLWDQRVCKDRFYGIILQEYNISTQQLTGPVKVIFSGTDLGCTEGAHLYKRNGFYYLLTAEGGTGYDHAVTMARSRRIDRGYQVHPHNPILTSKDKSHAQLKKAGHASIVDDIHGNWYLAHLCSRPLPNSLRCPLGRETAFQNAYWENDWLFIDNFDNSPKVYFTVPDFEIEEASEQNTHGPSEIRNMQIMHYDFAAMDNLPSCFQSLRMPLEGFYSFTARKGFLRLYGSKSLSSLHGQSLMARRADAFCSHTEVSIEFDPLNFQHTAGLIYYYNTKNYYYLYIIRDDSGQKQLRVLSCIHGEYNEQIEPIALPEQTPVVLQSDVTYEKIRFSCNILGEDSGSLCILDTSLLSDDYVQGAGFTGTFIGICCQDLRGTAHHADFSYFLYQRVPGNPNNSKHRGKQPYEQ